MERFLISKNLVASWKIVGQYAGQQDISDHCLIWLKASNVDSGPKPFKFNNYLLIHKDFLSFIENKWSYFNVKGMGILSSRKS